MYNLKIVDESYKIATTNNVKNITNKTLREKTRLYFSFLSSDFQPFQLIILKDYSNGAILLPDIFREYKNTSFWTSVAEISV